MPQLCLMSRMPITVNVLLNINIPNSFYLLVDLRSKLESMVLIKRS